MMFIVIDNKVQDFSNESLQFPEVQTEDNLQYQFYPVASGGVQFKVRASNDAHIALTMGPQETDPMIEVFIGGWKNTKSVIRRNRTQPDKVEAATPNILSANEMRGFWVRWDSGRISAGREGDNKAFLSWEDPQPFSITHVGVCTAWGATGTWKIEDDKEFQTPDKLEYKFGPVSWGYLEFDFRGPHNCHVCLTSAPGEVDPMYEVILGGWKNTQSVIRHCRQRPDKVTVPTPGIMDPNEFKKFLIDWRCGRLLVRDRTTGNMIMEWNDPKPFPITHFGVRTGYGARGMWRIQHFYETGAQPVPASVPAEIRASPKQSKGAGVWVNGRKGQLPPGAVVGGRDVSGESIYVARAKHGDEVLPGKFVPSHGCAYVPWGGKEHKKSEYQVLVGGSNKWVETVGDNVPANAFPAGETKDGEPLFVGRVSHEGSLTMGKVQQSHGVCYIAFGGKEIGYANYEVLVA